MLNTIYTLLIHMLNFVVLFVLMWFLLYGPVRKYLKSREEKVAGQLDKAKNAEAYAEEQRVVIDRELEEAKRIQASAMDTGMQAARLQSDEIIKAARDSSDDLLKDAHDKIEQDKLRAMQEIREHSVTVGMKVAAAVIGRNITVEDNQLFIDEYFKKVEK